ncbi:hypothetical protein OKW45_004293 [Paraburkholderia sp. WSM4175]
MRRLSVRAPSPRRGSASARRHWRGCFTNQPETGLRRIRISTSSRDSRYSRWMAPRCAPPTVPPTAGISAPPAAHGRIGSYPQLRAVTLTALATHLVRDAVFGPYDINEMVSRRELIPRVPANSITLFDRGFMSAQHLHPQVTVNNHQPIVSAPFRRVRRWRTPIRRMEWPAIHRAPRWQARQLQDRSSCKAGRCGDTGVANMSRVTLNVTP